MLIKEFVARLQNVKTKGRDQYLCSCPAHADSDPSLAVTATPSGKILLKCFAGCSALEIVQSMQLTLEDLFPDAHEEHPMAFAQREMASRKKEKETVDYARTYLAVLTGRLKRGGIPTKQELDKAYRMKQIVQNNAQEELKAYS
jgi:DNA primase